jgi:uncharacterized membrane protein (Fun14 family)
MSIVDSFGSTAATLGGGFFIGIVIGYAVKKVTWVKLWNVSIKYTYVLTKISGFISAWTLYINGFTQYSLIICYQ